MAVYLADLAANQQFTWDDHRDEALIWTYDIGTTISGTSIDVKTRRRSRFARIPEPEMNASWLGGGLITPAALANANVLDSYWLGAHLPTDRVVWLVDESRPNLWHRIRRLLRLHDPEAMDEPRSVCVYTSQLNGANLRLVAHVQMDLQCTDIKFVSADRGWMLFTCLHRLYALPLN